MDAMQMAIDEARRAGLRGEVPVGAVVIGSDGAVLARAGNESEASRDASAHAEMLALRRAARATGSSRLPDCDLVVTLEPCPMCAAAIGLFRVRRLIFGAYDPKGGAVDHGPRLYQTSFPHRPAEIIGGVREAECGALLRDFFEQKR